ncbi:MAG: hypothetical protein KU28_00355 [Sulfurovum sp. PC08-66]|nr:MAG: hypothetical protein KU28_00355 [Sulfurovum sp. PC08-66]KIM12421.1 MAG: hypothetical protein KU37_00475 [Sulfuricurvum sp. PC08-66]
MSNNPSLLIELPSWIGDAVMATPTIEALIDHLSPSRITLVGVASSIALFSRDTRFARCLIDSTKKSKNRFTATLTLAREIGAHDVALTFRATAFSHILLRATQSEMRIGKRASFLSPLFLTHAINVPSTMHYVERYFRLFNKVFDASRPLGALTLQSSPIATVRPTLAIVPGAAYGSAKRWYPQYYAEVAIALASHYDIVLLGGGAERDIADEIAQALQNANITLYQNLAGQTSIETLVDTLASVALFIGGDSGPMHIAAALGRSIVAIYGPTDYRYSHPWTSTPYTLVHKNLSCMPCAKRTCPLKHHDCMRTLTPREVIDVAVRLSESPTPQS